MYLKVLLDDLHYRIPIPASFKQFQQICWENIQPNLYFIFTDQQGDTIKITNDQDLLQACDIKPIKIRAKRLQTSPDPKPMIDTPSFLSTIISQSQTNYYILSQKNLDHDLSEFTYQQPTCFMTRIKEVLVEFCKQIGFEATAQKFCLPQDLLKCLYSLSDLCSDQLLPIPKSISSNSPLSIRYVRQSIFKYQQGEYSLNQLQKILNVSKEKVNDWISVYQTQQQQSQTIFDEIFKQNIVRSFLDGTFTSSDLKKMYNISKGNLHTWAFPVTLKSRTNFKATSLQNKENLKTTVKDQILEQLINKEISVIQASNKVGVSYKTIRDWIKEAKGNRQIEREQSVFRKAYEKFLIMKGQEKKAKKMLKRN